VDGLTEGGTSTSKALLDPFVCLCACKIVGRSVCVTLSFVLECYLILDQSDSAGSRFRKLKMKNRLL
jgi:hypothetical protein